MKIREYSKPSDLTEAYERLMGTKDAVVIAGGVFLRLQKRTVPLVIDLAELKISGVVIAGDHVKIGAMTTLRTLETHEALPKVLKEAMHGIAGVAVRNLATIGGSVMGRYPFSDVITALLALDAELEFHSAGTITLNDYLLSGLKGRDILKTIRFKLPSGSAYKAFRKVYTDFALLNIGLVKDGAYTLSIGSRPGIAKRIKTYQLEDLETVLSSFAFEDDLKASGEYRRAIAKALLEDLREEAKAWK